tara:strand:+ start:191 stop:373 length:183 start_codon:yes stop_codon:yes gene_type:complete
MCLGLNKFSYGELIRVLPLAAPTLPTALSLSIGTTSTIATLDRFDLSEELPKQKYLFGKD